MQDSWWNNTKRQRDKKKQGRAFRQYKANSGFCMFRASPNCFCNNCMLCFEVFPGKTIGSFVHLVDSTKNYSFVAEENLAILRIAKITGKIGFFVSLPNVMNSFGKRLTNSSGNLLQERTTSLSINACLSGLPSGSSTFRSDGRLTRM